MAMTETQARAAVLKVAHSQVGYNPGRTNSKYGTWHGKSSVLWCAAGSSWCFHEALGDEPAFAAIWREFTGRKGWSWTVRWRQWLQQYGRKVSLRDLQPGDQLFFKYPTSDARNTNPVNHVDFVVGSRSDHILTIGFNTPKPGTGGDPSNGRGVWYHRRAYSDRYIVDVYRPRWAAFVTPPAPTIPAAVTTALAALGFDTVTAYQASAGLTQDGIAGPLTRAALEADMATLTTLTEQITAVHAALVDQIAKVHQDVATRLDELNVIPTPEPTAPAPAPAGTGGLTGDQDRMLTRVDTRTRVQAAAMRQTMISLTRGNAVGDDTRGLAEQIKANTDTESKIEESA